MTDEFTTYDDKMQAVRSHAFPPCDVCGTNADDPEAWEPCGGPQEWSGYAGPIRRRREESGWNPKVTEECPSCDDASAAHLAGLHEHHA